MRTAAISATNNNYKCNSKPSFTAVNCSAALKEAYPSVASMVEGSKALQEGTKGRNILLDVFASSIVPKTKKFFGYHELKGDYISPNVKLEDLISRFTAKKLR